MAENLYVTATEAKSGKSVISLGLMEMLFRNVDKVAFFRPLIKVRSGPNKRDKDIDLISNYYQLNIPYESMYGYTTVEANQMISLGRYEELLEGIVAKYKNLEEKHGFVLVEGTDFEGSTSAFEFDINADIANNLGCPVILVANGYKKTAEETVQAIEMSLESLAEKGCNVVSAFINLTEIGYEITMQLKKSKLISDQLLYALPDNKTLRNPTVKDIANELNARILYGENRLNRQVESYGVAAMQLRNCLTRISNNSLVITPGDRADVIVACLAALSSTSMPDVAGIVLTGGLVPEEPIQRLIEGFTHMVPIISVPDNTFEAARRTDNVRAVIRAADTRKITQALDVFEKNTDLPELREKIIQTKISVVTPKMFEYRLLQRAREYKQHIVLPEGEEERILRAAGILRRRDVVDITLLGNEARIKDNMKRLGLKLEGASIVEIQKSDKFEDYCTSYYEARKHKGITIEVARDVMSDSSYFGTMMVHMGDADGMVSGAIHTTRHTLRPAFEFIKTKPGFSIISSVFFMCLEDRVLVYGDCAVNPDPNAQELAEIAVSSAVTAKTFGVEPRVAMLSYSTGESGTGDDVEKVREATQIAKEMAAKADLDVKIEGPLQYDAAVDLKVAQTKLPDSEVAGKATVFIFPDLNTGNNTYKAVQRSANAVAVGPVLQGLNKPVNDLSRGCTVTDIVNTVAITAIQARSEKGLLE